MIFFCKFLDQVCLQKTVFFWNNIEKNVFFLQSSIYIFDQFSWQHMCFYFLFYFFFIKKWVKKHISSFWPKIIKEKLPTKNLMHQKMPKNCTFKQNKIFWQDFHFFWLHLLKILLNPFVVFLKDKMHMLSIKVCLNCKVFKYWMKKTFFFSVSKKRLGTSVR